MKALVWPLLLCPLSLLTAQTPQQPTIKGHHLGETIAQFMASSPTLRDRLVYCIQHPEADPQQDNSPLAGLIQQSGLVNSSCSEVVKLTRPGATVLIRQGAFEDMLTGLVQLLGGDKKQGPPPPEIPRNLDFSGSVQFTDGRVALLELRLPGNWADSEDDLVSKFGHPTKAGSTTMQNTYGATDRIADVYWERPGYVAHAYETIDGNMNRFVTVEMMTPVVFQQWKQSRASRKNSLD